MKKIPLKKYASKFSEIKLWSKLGKYARIAGMKAVYSVLLLYYAYARKETPPWAKRIILGTLGYFLAPLDARPALTPLIGYTDDIGGLSFGLVTVAAYVNKDGKDRAREKLSQWFGQIDDDQLADVDKQL